MEGESNMSKKLHVAQMIDSLGFGGAESLIVTFAEVAKSKDLKVSVISLTDDAKYHPASSYTAQLRALDVTVYSIDSRKIYDPRTIFRLFKIFRQERFDIVQTHLSHGDILGALVGRLTGTPVVSTLHTPAPRHIGHYKIREFVWYFALRHLSRRVIAVGRIVEDVYRDILGTLKIDLVFNAVKIEQPLLLLEREAVRREILGNVSRPFILCVGRLVDGKGLSELITAFSNVLKKHPRAVLVLAGAGQLQQSLEAEAEALGSANSVKFLGMRDDVPRLLGAADIYVSASFWEGMSIALLEAMAAGLPIVATAVGEAPYLLAENRGVLIPPKDISSIENGLCWMLDNPSDASAMGSAVRKYAQDHCSPDIWLENLIEIYSKAIGVARYE
jgi:glycosyltransferase involved in cell wall biosynthesis